MKDISVNHHDDEKCDEIIKNTHDSVRSVLCHQPPNGSDQKEKKLQGNPLKKWFLICVKVQEPLPAPSDCDGC